MYEMDVQPVYRCRRCNKPFDKESTLKRHGYYCRSHTERTGVRSRACIACANSKARCDRKLPCTRCTGKTLKCHYPVGSRQSSGASSVLTSSPKRQNAVTSPTGSRPDVTVPQATSKGTDGFNTKFTAPSGPKFTDTAGDFLDFNIDLVDVDFWSSQIDDVDFQYHLPEPLAMDDSSTSSVSSMNQASPTTDSFNFSISPTPSYNLRSFVQRPKLKTGAQRTASLILHTLRAYPLMMLRDKALPPFIHPRLIPTDTENDNDNDKNDMMPLTNCISLMHMLGSGASGSRKLFWKNVRMECERLCAEALSIYILVRLDEGETDHNNFDSLLVKTVIVMATRFNSIQSDTSPVPVSTLYNSNNNLSTRWRTWLLEESARRLCIIYQVVDMLVYFEPGALCDVHLSELLLAPLPAKKQLWEATDEFSWKAENEKHPEALSTAFGLAMNGDLVRVDGGRAYHGDDRDRDDDNNMGMVRPESVGWRGVAMGRASWEEWCAGMDGLGGLVMLAASLAA